MPEYATSPATIANTATPASAAIIRGTVSFLSMSFAAWIGVSIAFVPSTSGNPGYAHWGDLICRHAHWLTATICPFQRYVTVILTAILPAQGLGAVCAGNGRKKALFTRAYPNGPLQRPVRWPDYPPGSKTWLLAQRAP